MKKRKINEDKVKEIFRAKKEFHKEMARLPFEEKIEILIKLQELAVEIMPSKVKRQCKVWKIS